MRRWSGTSIVRPDGAASGQARRAASGQARGAGSGQGSRAGSGQARGAGSGQARRAGSGQARGAGSGQASVELLAVLPVAGLVAMTAAQVLAAGLSAELAAHAAEAGAIALVRDEDPRAAARESLPGWSRDRVGIRVTGRSVRVRLPPPTLVPVLAGALTASAHADAGPRP